LKEQLRVVFREPDTAAAIALLDAWLAWARRPSLSTSGKTLTIEESMNLEGENGERRNVGDEHEWSWSCG